ncbi:zinc finger E-box-binding homeobox 2 [Pholidichthys leucotaenia]
MSEESRGTRRKQANPRRTRVHAEQVSTLGSDGEDKVGVWSLVPKDCQESADKTSLTPSEETEEPGSPTHRTQPHSLSPGTRSCWGQGESEAKSTGDATDTPTEKEWDQGPLMMYCKNADSQNALEDQTHYTFLTQLKKASTSASLLAPGNNNDVAAAYHQSRGHNELSPAIWSPRAQHCPSEGTDADTVQHACPFCHMVFHQGTSLRDHMKYCPHRDGEHMVGPLCGYSTTIGSQMERHLALHNQLDKSPLSLDQSMETRKFKCLQCGKAFKYKHHLKEHLRIHSGEKPYECSNCKKRFSHSGSYSSHLSSKKCLNGGGNTAGASGAFNGHNHSSYHYLFPTSPSAVGGRTTTDKDPLLGSPSQDNPRLLGQIPIDPHHFSMENINKNTVSLPRTSDLARLWDLSAEHSLRASILKESSLLPYHHSGTKFEQMLQETLHKEIKQADETDKGDAKERRTNHKGKTGPETKVSPDRKREAVRSREADGASSNACGVTCQSCLQLFTSVAELLKHECYLCKTNREAVDLSNSFGSKDPTSSPLFFPRSVFQFENSKPNEVMNSLPGSKSPLQKPSWHSVPQQLLVAMHSPLQPHHNALSPRVHWPSQEKGSPGQVMHPSSELPSPRARERIPSSEFSSPAGRPPELSSPRKDPSSQWTAQNEPLDLSLPKQFSEKGNKNKTLNGISAREEKRDLGIHQFNRPNLASHVSLHQLPIFSGSRAPVFSGPLYNCFPILSPSTMGLPRHDVTTPISFSHTANNPSFLSPMTYMMEADAEATLKRIYHERQGLMGEALNRSALDYLSLIGEGFEGEGGPARRRLKKTDEGLYACDICEKTFQKSSSLLRHKYEHTGKRPHECKICNKAFKHKHHLIEHSRLHSGEKPYQCDKCGKRFSHSGSYSQHMNHRYAYCSKDQDPDQDQEEISLIPGVDSNLMGPLTEDTPLSMDENQTAHSFLSDSSLDGLKEDDDEGLRGSDGNAEEAHVSLSEAAEDLRDEFIQESPTVENREQRERDEYDMGNNIDHTKSQLWDRDSQTEALDMCDLSPDIIVTKNEA